MINVIISSDPRYSINRIAVQTAVLSVLQRYNIRGRVEIEVHVVGGRKMHELNKKYRGIDKTTDVLSFALEDPAMPRSLGFPGMPLLSGWKGFVAAPDNILRLGSIVISYPQAVEDAVLEGISVDEEINFLVEHGTTHLLGIHHD